MAGSEGLSRAEKQHLSSPVEEASVFCRNWKEYYAAPECSVDLTFVTYSSAGTIAFGTTAPANRHRPLPRNSRRKVKDVRRWAGRGWTPLFRLV